MFYSSERSDIINSISGIVERITYKNTEDGFMVIKIKTKGNRQMITSTRYMWGLYQGSVVRLYGSWEEDKKYGRQFKVSKYEEMLPATVYGIEKYLGSGLIEGIGPSFAKKIVKYFKENTLNVIENQPEKLSAVEGLGQKKIDRIKKSWEEHKSIKKLMVFLQELEINTYFAPKIYKQYGSESIQKITENPYCLADDIYGIGFVTADAAARRLEKDSESYVRCRSGIIYVLNLEVNRDHCYHNFFDIVRKTSKKLDIEEAKIVMSEDNMIYENDIIAENRNQDDMRVYLPSVFYSENDTAELIRTIMKTKAKKKICYYDINSGIEYDEIQKHSIKCAVESKFMVLTGGPGTGKTTTIRGIIECFVRNKLKVLLAAPTGRAAKRISETSGLEAKTIHRLLECKSAEGFAKNEDNKLEGDVIIIDESSMIDIFLMYNLLKAIPPEMKVILAGDANQLPSVGPGNVLNDIIRSKTVSVIKLEKIYRQAGKSDIIKNAHRINCGEYPVFKKNNTDFFFIEENDVNKAAETVADLCSRRLPGYFIM